MKWFRVYPEILEDPQIGTLSDSAFRTFIELSCLSALCDNSGVAADSVCWRLRRNVTSDISVLIKNGLITIVCNKIYVQLKSLDSYPASWREIRSSVFEEDNYECQYCGERAIQLECDHIIPLSRGGGNGLENLITSCRSCNRSKKDKTLSEWLSYAVV